MSDQVIVGLIAVLGTIAAGVIGAGIANTWEHKRWRRDRLSESVLTVAQEFEALVLLKQSSGREGGSAEMYRALATLQVFGTHGESDRARDVMLAIRNQEQGAPMYAYNTAFDRFVGAARQSMKVR